MNPACSKVTFAEQIEGLTVRYQRRTPGLQAIIVAVATASQFRVALDNGRRAV